MSQKGLMDEVFGGIGNAVTDIRQRVVEEGWFGRVVTGNDNAPEISVAVEQPSAEPAVPGAPRAEPGTPGPAEPNPGRPPMAPPEPERPDPEPDMGR
ncbi:MAG: hypothetical protein KIT17_00900 [Rubrivivax sp.]|nr:hypothetical protein [Rubrivivax sp.]